MEYPKRNRAYFSEVQAATSSDKLDATNNGAGCYVHNMYTWNVTGSKAAPVLHEHNPGKSTYTYLAPAQRWITYPGIIKVEFPIQTIKPKVQKMLIAPPGEIPREVEVERQRRRFAVENIQDLVIQSGIDLNDLIPVHVTKQKGKLPLHWFDNFIYAVMLPTDWFKLGVINGIQHPVPAKAFLPDGPNEKNFKFRTVSVFGFCEMKYRFYVTDIETGHQYLIPKLYFNFLAENPFYYINRLKYALDLRRQCEHFLKFSILVDCMKLTGIQELSHEMLKKICRLINMQNDKQGQIVNLIAEVKLEYQRVFCEIDLKMNFQRNPEEFQGTVLPVLDIFDNTEFKVSKFSEHSLRFQNFVNFGVKILQQGILYCLDESLFAMRTVVTSCQKVSNMSLFNLNLTKNATLADFSSIQLESKKSTMQYLRGFWVDNMSEEICLNLRFIGKGWFDISVKSWEIYLVAKLRRFMILVQLRMESSLRDLILKSTEHFTDTLCNPCEVLMSCTENYVWGIDLINSPFQSSYPFVFTLTMKISGNDPLYSTDPAEFIPTLIKLFDDAIMQTHTISEIEPRLLVGLVFAKNSYLSSVGLLDEIMVERRQRIIKSYEKAVIPLKAYCLKYLQFVEFYNLDIPAFLEEVRTKTPQEIKELISLQYAMMEYIMRVVPTSIIIGPFNVIADPLKQFLYIKRQDLKTKILEMFTDRLTNETTTIIESYMALMKRLNERPISIEHIFELNEWIETIPQIIQTTEDGMRTKLFEYEILDYFRYPLPNFDFKTKWDAIAWPMKILNQIPVTKEMYETDTEKFQKNQIFDLSTYDERVEGLNIQFDVYRTQYDASKATEFSIEIKKIWKSIDDLMELGKLLNKRQKLFDNAPIDLTGITTMVKNFDPYRKLWLTGADLRKYIEVWCGNPFSGTDLDSIKTTIAEYEATLEDVQMVFVENENLQIVCQTFINEIGDFKPVVQVMDCLKNPYWANVHWQKLQKISGMEFKLTQSVNFQYFMKKGIMTHIDLVQELSDEAIREHEAVEAAEAEAARQAQILEEFLMAKTRRRENRTDLF